MKNIIWSAIIAAAVSLLIISIYPAQKLLPGVQQQRESIYDRVMRTKTIRCSYASYPPFTTKDPNSGQLSGVFYDLIEEMGRRWDLDIQWVEEVSYGNIPEGYATHRYDLFCSPIWPNALRSKTSMFSIPLYYSVITTWVRSNDNRFDTNLNTLNDPQYKIAVVDGDVTNAIAQASFPKAQHLPIALGADFYQQWQDVVSGKADAVFGELISAELFLKNNPGSLKNASPTHPIRVLPNTIMLPPNEQKFMNMINVLLFELQNEDFLQKTLAKHISNPSLLLPANYPYRMN